MDTRSSEARVTANVRESIISSGADISAVAVAADVEPSDLELRNSPDPAPLTVGALLRVGGALRVPADHFLRGAA